MFTVIVVAGGETAPPAQLRSQLPRGAPVLAADSGLAHAEALGLRVERVIGDMDSVSDDALARAIAAGIGVDRHPATKDETDLELTLDAATEQLDPGGRLVVVTSVGGRLDHALANLMVLASPKFSTVTVDAYVDSWRVAVIRPPGRSVPTRAGQLVTLLPIHGAAEGVRTRGLHYALHGERLAPGTSRGVSNVATGESAEIEMTGGVLLAMCEWAD